jgi:hypothetical protein
MEPQAEATAIVVVDDVLLAVAPCSILGFGVVAAPCHHWSTMLQAVNIRTPSNRSCKLSNSPCKGKIYSHNQPTAKTVKAREIYTSGI